MAYRTSVSAGVSETILSGLAASLTTVPSSSVREIGKLGLGATDGSVEAEGAIVAVAGGSSEPVASGGVVGRGDAADPQAPTTIANVATSAATRRERMGGSAGWANTSGSRSRAEER